MIIIKQVQYDSRLAPSISRSLLHCCCCCLYSLTASLLGENLMELLNWWLILFMLVRKERTKQFEQEIVFSGTITRLDFQFNWLAMNRYPFLRFHLRNRSSSHKHLGENDGSRLNITRLLIQRHPFLFWSFGSDSETQICIFKAGKEVLSQLVQDVGFQESETNECAIIWAGWPESDRDNSNRNCNKWKLETFV